MALRTVAIAGATGNLGTHVARAFLSPQCRTKFQDIVVLARAESKAAAELAAAGAKLRVYDEDNLAQSLQGVDVLISVVGPSGHAFKEKLLRSLPATSVSLYFPSEFGVNHYIHDFPHEEWDTKKRHFELAKQLIPNIRRCRVYAGLLLEDSIGPWFGFNTKDGRYEAVGSPSQRTSYISKSDIGRALANLASLPLGDVPDEVSLNGDSKSFQEIADIMRASGAGQIDVTSVPLAAYKAQVLADPSPTPERYLRFLMGEGKIDHSDTGLGNQNGVVLRGGPVAWMRMQDLAKETGGKPWASSV
ncbi:hypothetical protein H634G_05532 [Metarhizium anisopliae BRIP 53293]|uniref:NmrA-like domain-containing protein n=1 Tax=Metarhizium anisopliae BRIP 53293 TaxID=1291518 RepID=A0A0D9NZ07_METAN|nr:hypothetical protein H634G_05532 [Metarhizium anisopliae BRIP 53293]KJK95613.1 hypothetical protein H633G_00570 [Metarhizium anisopliae BRIP 53284]